MKKIKYAIYTILLTILLILLSNSTSNATFYINDFNIFAEVKENGDMQIVENIQYYSDVPKNGVTREINVKNEYNSKNSADNLILEDVLVDSMRATKVSSGTLGQNGVYEYKKSGSTHSLKVYMPMSYSYSYSNSYRTVTYMYTLKNVAVKYNDTAEIFWNFIGDEWDTDIKKVNIVITLPKSAGNDTIYVYGHGSDNGTFTKRNNVITLRASNLQPYQALDARILFSPTSISQSTKTYSKSVLNTYINQEEGITKEYEQPSIIGDFNINQIATFLSVVIVLIGLFLYFKFDKEYKVEKCYYYREIPYNLSPEILQTVFYGKIQKNAFFVTFLNLVKKGVYKITKTSNEVGKETQLISYNENHSSVLEDYEKEVINSFTLGKNHSIDVLKLKQKLKTSSYRYYKNYKTKLNSKKDGLFGEKAKPNKKVTTFLGIAMAILVIFMVFIAFKTDPEMSFGVLMFLLITTVAYTAAFKSISFNLFTVGFFTVHCGMFQIANIFLLKEAGELAMYIPYVLLFILLQYAFRIEKSSKEERQVLEQIKGLRRYIRDFSSLSEKEDIGQLTIWEDFFILSIALGLNKRVVNYFYDYCKDNFNDNFGTSLAGFSSYSIMSTSLATSFVSYAHRTTITSSSSGRSSYSGSSGGFSGGSSSGGGGRRWRRRKLILEMNNTLYI